MQKVLNRFEKIIGYILMIAVMVYIAFQTLELVGKVSGVIPYASGKPGWTIRNSMAPVYLSFSLIYSWHWKF